MNEHISQADEKFEKALDWLHYWIDNVIDRIKVLDAIHHNRVDNLLHRVDTLDGVYGVNQRIDNLVDMTYELSQEVRWLETLLKKEY
jgi:hypothetical protein